MSKTSDPKASDPQQSDPAGGEPLPSQPDAPESAPSEPDQVGPGRPPRDTRWKKGGPSPNPRGRPRKDRSMLPDLRQLLDQALNKKVPVQRDGRTVLMTQAEMGIEQLINQFVKGDRFARRELIDHADRLGIDFVARHRQAVEQALAPNYEAILDAAVARRSVTGVATSAERELAPPELLDDDVAEDLPVETESAPAAKSKPQCPEPTPEPGKKYPKPFSQMTRSEMRAWYPEWWEKNGEAWEKQRAEEQKAAAKLDQASLGRGNPPPGGYSVTTGKRS